MIRIHRCKLTITGNDALRDGSTISMDRIKKILAKHLAVLEDIPGRVHIKKVTLDLSDFQPLSINPEFIERLEETCANLGKKLKEIHAAEIAKSGNTTSSKQDQNLKDELVGALYDLDQTKGIQNALFLIESEKSIQSILDWDVFQKKYSFLFKKGLSAKESKWIKELLERFQAATRPKIDVKAATSDWIEQGKKYAVSSREIDFILARMDKISIDSNWLNALEKAYFQEFQRGITPALMTHLKQLYDSFEFSLNNQTDTRVDLPGKSASIQSDLLHYFAGKGKNARLDELMEVIESAYHLDDQRWFYSLLKSYKQEHGCEMPVAHQQELLHFNAWRSSKSWEELPRKKRTAFVSKLKKYSAHFAQQVQSSEEKRFTAKSYQFVLDLLETTELNAAWYGKIAHAYQQEFKTALPTFLADLLHQFSTDITKVDEPKHLPVKVAGSKSTWLNVALAYFRNRSNSSDIVEVLEQFDRIKPNHVSQWNRAFEKFIRSHTGESLDAPRFDELRRFELHFRLSILKQHFDKNRKELERMLDQAQSKGKLLHSESTGNWELQTFVFLDILSEIEFNATWTISLKQRFKQLLGIDLPKVFLVTLERYMETYVFTETKNLPRFSTASTQRLVSVETLRNTMEDEATTGSQGVNELLTILSETSDPQQYVEMDSLFEGFESVYNRQMPDALKMRLQAISSSSSEWKVQLSRAVEAAGLSENERLFFLSCMKSAPTYAHWRNTINAHYTESFAQSLPEKLNKLIARLEAEWYAAQVVENEFDLKKSQRGISTNESASLRQSNNQVDLIQQEFEKLRVRKNASDRAATQQVELNFVLAFLDAHGLTLGWKAKLAKAFQSAFSLTLPTYIQQVLDEVDSAANESSMKEVEAHTSMDAMPFRIDDFLEILTVEDDFGWHERLLLFLMNQIDSQVFLSFDELIARYESATNESIPIVIQMNVRNALKTYHQQELNRTKGQLARKIQAHLEHIEAQKREQEFIHQMLIEFPFDEQWYSRVQQQFKQLFKKKMSKELEEMTVQFMLHAQARLDRDENIFPNSRTHHPSFFTDLKAYVEMHADVTSAERMADLLEKGSIDVTASWIHELSQAYASAYDEELPSRIHGMLLEFVAQRTVISWDTISSEKRTKFFDRLRPVLAKSDAELIINDKSAIDFSSFYAWMLALLETTPLNAAWYATLSKAFSAEFNQPIPDELNALLLDFSSQLFTSNASTPLQVSEEIRHLDYANSAVELTESVKSPSTDEHTRSISESLVSALRSHLESQEVGADIDKLWKVLVSFSVPPNANWMTELAHAYSAQYGEKLPQELNEVLVSFATSRLQQSWNTISSEKCTNFLDELRPLLAKSDIELTKNDKAAIDFSSFYAWMLALLETTPLNAAWYTTLSKAFSAEFNQPFPEELDALLLDFSRELFSSNASTSLQVSEEIRHLDYANSAVELTESVKSPSTDEHTRSISESLVSALRSHLESQEVGADIDKLWKVLVSFSVPPNANWISELSLAYSAEHGEKIPQELNEGLVAFATSRLRQTWITISSEKSTNFLNHLRSALAKSDVELTKNDKATLNFSNFYAWMLALLESTPLNAAWYATLSKAFLAEFNQSLPEELDVLLLDFSRELFSSNASRPLQVSDEIHDLNRANSTLELSESVTSPSTNEHARSTSESFVSALKSHLEAQEVEADVDKLMKVLESFSVPPNANWMTELARAYSAHYGEKIPHELNEVFVSFATARVQQSWITFSSENSTNFLDQLRPLLAKSEGHLIKNDNATIDFSILYAWMLALLETTPLNASWYATLSKAFSGEFNQPLPEELDALLLDFSSQLFTSNASTPLQVSEEIHHLDRANSALELTESVKSPSTNEHARSTSESFVSALKSHLESQEVGADVEKLLKVLKSFSVPPNANWISELSMAYSAEYNEKIPHELNEVFVSFATSRLQQSWKAISSEKSTNFFDQLRPVLAKSDVELTKNDNATLNFSNFYAWILALLESTPLNAAWYATLSKAFLAEFNQSLPEELNALLLDFSRELFSAKALRPLQVSEEIHHLDRANSALELTESVKSPSTNEHARSISESFVSALTSHLEAQEVGADVEKLLKVLESFSVPPNANWISELSLVYFVEYNEKIPHELNEVLVSFATSRLHQLWNSVSSEKRTKFMDQLGPLLAKSDVELTKNDKASIDFSSFCAWMLALLESTPLNAAWYASLSKAFLAEFNRSIPNELNALLLDFSREFSTGTEASLADELGEHFLLASTIGSLSSADYGEAESAFDGIHNVALDTLKHLCTDEEFLHLRNWLEAGSPSLEAEWLGILQQQYPKGLEQISDELKSVLHRLATVFDRFKSHASKPQAVQSLLQLIRERYPQQSRSTIDFKITHFLSEWLKLSNFSRQSIQTLEAQFQQQFDQVLDVDIQFYLHAMGVAFGTKSKRSVVDPKGEEGGNAARVQEFIANNLQQKWMFAKVEQLVIGRLSLDDLSNEYRAFFGLDIPPQFNQIAREALEKAQWVARENSTILEEIRQFLRNKPMDATVLALISFFENSFDCSPSNWFKVSLENYATRFNQQMPMAMQHHLLSFAAQRSSSHSSNEAQAFREKMEQQSEALAQNWESFSLKELTSMTHSNFRELEAQLYFVQSFIKSTWFTQADLDLLELDFERKIGAQFPVEWKQQLVKWVSIDSDQPSAESSIKEKMNARSVRNKLMEYLGTLEKTDEVRTLQRFIAAASIEQDTNWFPTLLAHYLETEGQKMPHGLQAILLRFMQARTEHRAQQAENHPAEEEDGIQKAIARAKQVLERSFQQTAIAPRTESHQLEDVLSEIWKEKRTEWVDDFAQEYKKTYQRWFPNELAEALKSLDDGSILLDSNKTQKVEENRLDVKGRLLHFLELLPQTASNQLLEIISEQETLHPETWYESLREIHKRHFGTPLSESDQHVLLKFAANDEFTVTEMERLSRVRAKTEIAAKLVTDFFANQNKEGQKVDYILYFLESRIERDGMLTSDWKAELRQRFLTHFSEELPIGIVTHIENCLREQPFDSTSSRLETELLPMVAVHNGLTNTELKKRRESVRKPLTNKAKLLQLKEKLEAMKKGKKVEELPLISNAGIILGWVFWKSTFAQFEWLDEGKFREVNGIDSSILAANWLHYSVNESETVNPLILAICDLSEERYEQLSIEELEANMNGNQLETSITNFYETILSMWPIFEINQHQELIELFISREGILGESPIGRRLKMVKEPFDHLLTIHPIPWPISILNFSWTSLIIEVVWD